LAETSASGAVLGLAEASASGAALGLAEASAFGFLTAFGFSSVDYLTFTSSSDF